jgi:hypothetical protein
LRNLNITNHKQHENRGLKLTRLLKITDLAIKKVKRSDRPNKGEQDPIPGTLDEKAATLKITGLEQ